MFAWGLVTIVKLWPGLKSSLKSFYAHLCSTHTGKTQRAVIGASISVNPMWSILEVTQHPCFVVALNSKDIWPEREEKNR